MTHLSKEDAIWLIEEYGPMRGFRIDVKNFKVFLKAYNLLRNTDRRIGCFTCEARSITAVANSMFEQYEADIRAIAYPPVKKKGRKKKTEE